MLAKILKYVILNPLPACVGLVLVAQACAFAEKGQFLSRQVNRHSPLKKKKKEKENFWMMFLLGQSFPQFSLISSHKLAIGYDVSALILGPSSGWISKENSNGLSNIGKRNVNGNAVHFWNQKGPSIRAETSYPIASLWLEMRENCGKKRKLKKTPARYVISTQSFGERTATAYVITVFTL